MDARNMYRREINILSRIVHLVGLIYKIMQGCRSTKHKIINNIYLKFNMQFYFMFVVPCIMLQ